MSEDKLAMVDFLMEMEALRLKSYEDWPLTFMDPHKLATAGFYCTCLDDMVRCAFCKGVLGNWKQGYDPFDMHRRLRPTCSFIVNRVSTDLDIAVDEGVFIKHCKYYIH
jgi:hypothetical protein